MDTVSKSLAEYERYCEESEVRSNTVTYRNSSRFARLRIPNGPARGGLMPGLMPPQKRLRGGRERKEQGSGLAEEGEKAVVFVKGDCLVILSINQQCERRDWCFEGPARSVGQQRATETASLKTLIDRQASNPRGGQNRVSGQTLRQFRRKIG